MTESLPRLGPRVVVGGVSGSGKTTLAREIARRLGAPHIELDAHFHRPGWTSASDEEFAASVAAALTAAGDRWVVDGNYTRIRDVTWSRATTFVWLDFRRGVATWRAVRRTIPRLLRRTELWHGNRERLRNLFDSAHPIWWSWHHHGTATSGYEEAVADPRWKHVQVVRLRSPRAVREWLATATEVPARES